MLKREKTRNLLLTMFPHFIHKPLINKNDRQLLQYLAFHFIEIVFLFWSIYYFLSNWIADYQLRFSFDVFDASLRLLSGLYASEGLTPYKDFSFVYPPGLVIISQLFHVTPISYYHIFSLLVIVTVSCFGFLFLFKTRSAFYTGIFLLLLTVMMHPMWDPLADLLWICLIVSIYYYLLEKKSWYLAIIFLLVFSSFLVKWDRIVMLTALLVIGSVALFIFKKLNNSMLSVTKTCLYGIGAAMIFLVIYLFMQGINTLNALYFIFIVPIKILPYRALHPPGIHLNENFFQQNYLLYMTGILFVAFIVQLLIEKKKWQERKNIILIFLIGVPLTTISYALGRSDITHVLPFFYTVFLVILLWCVTRNTIYPLLVVGLLYFANFFSVLGSPSSTAQPYTVAVTQSLANCKKLVSNLQYQSLFVGRTDYSKYIINYAELYLVNPSIKPATQYISDEPGLQNSCYDGQRVAADLETAKKPMLAFLDTTAQWTEPNLSAHMQSCGRIEQWLSTNSYRTVGSCSVDGRPFLVRLY